ncbi:MAG: hypothetical protein M5U27_11460 [Gaiella sp.]|nr:hypothetical protein [Gaiella sp.]
MTAISAERQNAHATALQRADPLAEASHHGSLHRAGEARGERERSCQSASAAHGHDAIRSGLLEAKEAPSMIRAVVPYDAEPGPVRCRAQAELA